MNEFEWRRQMRALREPVTPGRDLWGGIEAALGDASREAAPAPPPRSGMPLWLLAASFAGITVLAVGLGLRHDRAPVGVPLAAAGTLAGAPWKPQDPRLAGAAIVLDAAGMELRQAIEQSPDSPALQRLMQRTRQQQSRLRHLDRAS